LSESGLLDVRTQKSLTSFDQQNSIEKRATCHDSIELTTECNPVQKVWNAKNISKKECELDE